jgi:hypothetical protein
MHLYSVDSGKSFQGGFESALDAGLAAAAEHPAVDTVIITEVPSAVAYRIVRTTENGHPIVTFTEI